jgi:hypothetical protein
MSNRLSRFAVGLVTLLIAGGAVACPGATKDKSADMGHGSSAPTHQTSGRT